MRGGSWLTTAGRTALFVTIFLVLALPWLERSWTMLPADDATEDAWLILWVLDWVRHALATDPRAIFDPPVNYPAPKQLSGSEHFLASQLLFAPLQWLTGSSLAAANLTAMLSYGLAAAAMDALLRALGVGRGAAFVAALVYGFGWQAVPGRLHILQSQHLFLPLTALALHRLRDRPTAWRALAFGATFATGLLSSYHMAVYLAAGMAVWGFIELRRRLPARARYVAWAGIAAAAAVGLLVFISLPYLTRPEATGDFDLGYSRWQTKHLAGGSVHSIARVMPPSLMASSYLGCMLGAGLRIHCISVDVLLEWFRADWTLGFGPAAAVVPVLVLVALASAVRDRGVRRLCVVGAALMLLRSILGGPEYVQVGDLEIPLRSLLTATPARFIRVPNRALVLAAFGGTLILAAGTDVVLRRLGRLRLLAVPLLAVALVVRLPPPETPARPAAPLSPIAEVVERWGRLSPTAYLDNPALGTDASSYRVAATLMGVQGTAPVLDLPVTRDGTTVVGQMILRQPTISFYTGYVPAHLSIIDRLIARLPDGDALDDLVDMTRLGWIIVRDVDQWSDRSFHRRFVAELTTHPRVKYKSTVGRFTVLRLDATPKRPRWFESLAAGPQRGRSALGTELEPLPVIPNHAMIGLPAITQVRANAFAPLKALIVNRGTHAWAAAIPERPDTPFTVQIVVRLMGPDVCDEIYRNVYQLDRDVEPGETFTRRFPIFAPVSPGTYRVEVSIEQLEGTALWSTRNPSGADVQVLPEVNRSGR